jgi:dipeptidase E
LFILTSSGFLNPEVMNVINKKNHYISTVCIITTGQIPKKEKHPNCETVYSELQRSGFKEIKFLDIEYEDPLLLLDYDLIILMGGNSRFLFDILRKTNTDKILLEIGKSNKIVLGISAGSMFLAGGNKHCAYIDPILKIDQEFYEGFDYSGLEIVKDLILPHIEKFYEICEDLDNEIIKIEEVYKIKITKMKRMDFVVLD